MKFNYRTEKFNYRTGKFNYRTDPNPRGIGIRRSTKVRYVTVLLYSWLRSIILALTVDRKTFTQRNVYTEELLHRRAFTHRNFYAEELQKSFYTQRLLHTRAFTQKNFYTENLLDRRGFTQELLHRKLLHRRTFTEAFTMNNFNIHYVT